MLRALLAFLSVSLLLAGCSDDPGGSCDGLDAELAGATSGDVVTIGACRVDGELVVPPGVTLEGVGADSSTIAAPSGTGAVTLMAGSTLRNVRVEGAGGVAVHAIGDVTISGVTVETDLGTAIFVEGGSPVLRDLTLRGPVTEANATSIPTGPTPEVTATHGLALAGAGTAAAPAMLSNIDASGFARFGVVAENSVLVWDGGSASGNLSVGVMISGGDARLSNLTVCNTFEGIQTIPGYGMVLSATTATTTNLTICDNEGYGLLHEGVTASHVDIVGSGNSEAALWVQRSTSLSVSGAASSLTDNRLAGLVLVETAAADVQEISIESSRLATRIDMGLEEISVGDGIHVVASSTDGLSFQDVELLNNERIGMLLQVDSGVVGDDVLSNVVIEARGAGLGVIAQTDTGILPEGTWTAGIDRRGVAAANDAAATSRLDVLGIVGPMFLPRP